MSTDSASQPAPQIILQERHSWFGRLGRFLLAGLVICFFIILGLTAQYQSYFNEPGGPQERHHSLSKTATDKVAVLSVTGAIMESDDFVKKQIDRIKKDDSVKAVVLRINSPGGTVTYSDYLLHHLRKLIEEKEIPVVVSMGSICASGGYYLAMAVGDREDAIFAEPTTWTGSIGVIIPHYDLSGLTSGRLGIVDDSIASGPLKQMGSPTRKMSDEERALFQELVDETFNDFKEIVKSGRPEYRESPEALDAVATGQIFTANQALENGLVDKIGFVEDAIDRALELAGLDEETARCVKYEKEQAPLDALLGASATASAASPSLRSLIDLSTPRAYYLWSTLPTLMESR